MQLDFARHQAGQRVLAFQHFHTGTQQITCANQTVQPDVGAIQNGVDEATVHRLVELAPERLDECVGDVVEHTAERDEVVLHIRGLGVARSMVAPSGPAAHKVQEGADARGINDKGLIIGQVDGVAVVIAQAVDVNGLVGGAFIGNALVAGIGFCKAARLDGGAVETQITEGAIGPAQDGLFGIGAAVFRLNRSGIGLCGNVHQSLAGKHTVDRASLCVHNRCNGCILREAGSHNQVGHDAEHGQAQLDLLNGGGHIGSLGSLANGQENDRLAGAQLEVIVHHLADGVLGPVVVIAQLLLCFIIAGAEHREASGRRGTGRLGQRCGANDKGNAAGCGVRCRHGGVGAADIDTMICHSMYSSLLGLGEHPCKCKDGLAACFYLFRRGVQLVHIDDEVGHTGIFLGGNLHIITLYGLRSSAGVNRVFLDVAQNGRADVNRNAGLALCRLGAHGVFGVLFRRGLFHRHNSMSSVCCTVGSFQ